MTPLGLTAVTARMPSDMVQVLSLMAIPALILGAIGYINRRGDRRFFAAEQARRSDAMVPVRHSS